MDLFCLFDESEGDRCACSDAVNQTRSTIQDIERIQAEAELLFSEGVERERLGAAADFVFGASQRTQANTRRPRIDLQAWLNTGNANAGVGIEMGDALFRMAQQGCHAELQACGEAPQQRMEENLYIRQISSDCRQFNTFLTQQQRVANQNLQAAQRAVRGARLAEMGTTQRFNRGECLIAMRNCVAEKGGCGDNFENCLTESLLRRRTHACANITDQCTAVRTYVMEDWNEEIIEILANANRFADRYRRQTCLSRIEACLEDHCSVGTNDQCLNDVNVAAGICPEITECNQMIPGIRDVVNSRLGFIRVRFCQNDVTSCLQEACGADFTNPACVGRSTREIAAMCPQNRFPSCAGRRPIEFESIVSSTLLQVDYQLMQGCINQFETTFMRVCGADMVCINDDPRITTARNTSELTALLRNRGWREFAHAEVARVFDTIERDVTIGACADSQNPRTARQRGQPQVNRSIFTVGRLMAEIQAEDRQHRSLITKMRELARQEDIEQAREACLAFNDDDDIDSAIFEPSLRNCQICRNQRVCEEGGQSRAQGAAMGAAGGVAAGASAGMMLGPWGAAIGGAVGGIGKGILGGLSAGGVREFCQELRSCDDINM